MKKLVVLFLACMSATVVSALAFVNNCFVVFKWWQNFFRFNGDTSVMKEEIQGFVSWLNWANVDYSTVTTLIPMVGFLCMTLACVRLMRGKRVHNEDFPFFKGSDQLNVALGLFGTLWGIIVIGYFNLDTVTMADLMQCLHTALFSTLMAVVWVFMIDRPMFRPYFQKLAMNLQLDETDGGDLAETVDRFIVRLGKAADAFDARIVAFENALQARQKEYADAFEKMMAASEAASQKRMASYEKEFEARQKEYVELFKHRLEALEANAKEANERANSANARLAAVTKALQG